MQMAQRLTELRMPHELTVRRGGHSWMYWEDDLFSTWRGIARDLHTS